MEPTSGSAAACGRILGNEADAADAPQEGVVSAWRRLPRLRDQSSFDSWLNRIVANAARMSRRHRVRLREDRVVPVADDEGAARGVGHPDPAAGRQIEAIASADAIGRAFDRLREQDRLILALHRVDERPLAEIPAPIRGLVPARPNVSHTFASRSPKAISGPPPRWPRAWEPAPARS